MNSSRARSGIRSRSLPCQTRPQHRGSVSRECPPHCPQASFTPAAPGDLRPLPRPPRGGLRPPPWGGSLDYPAFFPAAVQNPLPPAPGGLGEGGCGPFPVCPGTLQALLPGSFKAKWVSHQLPPLPHFMSTPRQPPRLPHLPLSRPAAQPPHLPRPPLGRQRPHRRRAGPPPLGPAAPLLAQAKLLPGPPQARPWLRHPLTSRRREGTPTTPQPAQPRRSMAVPRPEMTGGVSTRTPPPFWERAEATPEMLRASGPQ